MPARLTGGPPTSKTRTLITRRPPTYAIGNFSRSAGSRAVDALPSNPAPRFSNSRGNNHETSRFSRRGFAVARGRLRLGRRPATNRGCQARSRQRFRRCLLQRGGRRLSRRGHPRRGAGTTRRRPSRNDTWAGAKATVTELDADLVAALPDPTNCDIGLTGTASRLGSRGRPTSQRR